MLARCLRMMPQDSVRQRDGPLHQIDRGSEVLLAISAPLLEHLGALLIHGLARRRWVLAEVVPVKTRPRLGEVLRQILFRFSSALNAGLEAKATPRLESALSTCVWCSRWGVGCSPPGSCSPAVEHSKMLDRPIKKRRV